MPVDDEFRLAYLCGFAQGWGWASSPCVSEKAKRLVYWHRMKELLDSFYGLELEDLLEQCNQMCLQELDMSSHCTDGEVKGAQNGQ